MYTSWAQALQRQRGSGLLRFAEKVLHTHNSHFGGIIYSADLVPCLGRPPGKAARHVRIATRRRFSHITPHMVISFCCCFQALPGLSPLPSL